MFSSREIQNRVKTGYIERLGTRLKKMRKQLVDRDWPGLKTEAGHLAEGAQNFGYPDLADEVSKAIAVLNTRPLSRTAIDPHAKEALEKLFQTLDQFLVRENH
jgi:hypothetical protein